MSIDIIIEEISTLLEILNFLQVKLKGPARVFIDNKSAIELVTTLKNGSKHGSINRRINTIREAINARKIVCIFVPSPLNVADTLTKPLPAPIFERHNTILLEGHNGKDPAELIDEWLQAYNERVHISIASFFGNFK
jgi:hypothetical protein